MTSPKTDTIRHLRQSQARVTVHDSGVVAKPNVDTQFVRDIVVFIQALQNDGIKSSSHSMLTKRTVKTRFILAMLSVSVSSSIFAHSDLTMILLKLTVTETTVAWTTCWAPPWSRRPSFVLGILPTMMVSTPSRTFC